MKRIVLVAFVLLFLAGCAGPVVEPVATTTTQPEATTEPEIIRNVMRLNDNITVFEVMGPWFPREIRVRDESTGEETLLAEDTQGYFPMLGERINERFFIYYYGWEGCGSFPAFIYDVERNQSFEFGGLSLYIGENGRIYVYDAPHEEAKDIPVEFFYISALENDEELVFQCAGMNLAELFEHLGMTVDGVWQWQHEEEE